MVDLVECMLKTNIIIQLIVHKIEIKTLETTRVNCTMHGLHRERINADEFVNMKTGSA